nr:MAG TPA: hypothetical protein [Caudoviricetes sp.]
MIDITFVEDFIKCPCASALDAGGVLFLIHTSGFLFTVGTFGKTQRSSRAAILAVLGTGFDPGKEFPFREHRAAAEFLVRDSLFVDQVVECRPCGGNALLGHKSGGILDIHSIGLDGFILAPEVGEFRKNRGNLVGDDGAKFRGSCDDNGIIHCVVKF